MALKTLTLFLNPKTKAAAAMGRAEEEHLDQRTLNISI